MEDGRSSTGGFGDSARQDFDPQNEGKAGHTDSDGEDFPQPGQQPKQDMVQTGNHDNRRKFREERKQQLPRLHPERRPGRSVLQQAGELVARLQSQVAKAKQESKPESYPVFEHFQQEIAMCKETMEMVPNLFPILKKYDTMLESLQIGCRIEALKHNQEANGIKRNKLATRVIRFLTVVGMGAGIVNFFSNGADLSPTVVMTRIGALGFGFYVANEFLQFYCQNTASLLPTCKDLAEEHLTNSFEWELLWEEVKVTRLLLRNPNVELPEIKKRYLEHIKTRQELSVKVFSNLPTIEKQEMARIEQDEHEFFKDCPIPY